MLYLLQLPGKGFLPFGIGLHQTLATKSESVEIAQGRARMHPLTKGFANIGCQHLAGPLSPAKSNITGGVLDDPADILQFLNCKGVMSSLPARDYAFGTSGVELMHPAFHGPTIPPQLLGYLDGRHT